MNLALTQASPEPDAVPHVLEALDALRVAITVFDADVRLTYVNGHLGHLFRTLPPRETLIGRSYEEFIGLPALADVEGFVDRARLFSGDFSPRELSLKDGRTIEIKVRRTTSGAWIALWSDVTTARQNLQRLRTAIALSADAFAFFDRADRLALCNEEYALLNGVSSPQEMTGCSFAEVVERICRNVAEGPARADFVKRRHEAHQQPAGSMTVEFAWGGAYLLRDRANEDGGRVVVFTDVTEHRRAEKALAEQTRTLADTRKALARSKAESARQANYLADLAIKLDQTAQQADSTKRTLLRTMSHELKTPLNAIIGFSDLLGSLADHAGPDQIREYSGLIHQGGRNLLRLINQILDLTKISAGRYELNRQTMDACAGLWLAKDSFQERADAKNIRLEVEDCEKGLMVDVDEAAYSIMLGHLVENAVHFTQPGGHVLLKAERVDRGIRVRVKDDGPGVAREDLERILQPFEQGGRTTADHAGGAGLGLTLVKAFTELHGGTLTVESAPGEGFTAAIEFAPGGA
jgi:two-component system cell cycle sensor histidine kinase PleC